MKQFARFVEEIPARVLFMIPNVQGSVIESLHNEQTLILFAEWLKVKKSKKTGKFLAAKSVAGYVSMAKAHMSRTYGFEVAPSACKLRGILKAMIRTDPNSSIRKKRVGIRRPHLEKSYEHVVKEKNGHAKAAMLATAWAVLARPGEVSNAGLRRSDLKFVKAKGKIKEHCVLWLRPIKSFADEDAPRVPILIAKANGKGADAFRLLKKMIKKDKIAKNKRNITPLFRVIAGKHINKPINQTTFVRLCKLVAKVNRLLVKWVAGHSCRIGGATDLMGNATFDCKYSLKAAGRWAGDVGEIYARRTRKAQLLASSQMHMDGGEDLEQIFPSYTQCA